MNFQPVIATLRIDGSHWAYAYIDAECRLQILLLLQNVCGGQNVTLTAPARALLCLVAQEYHRPQVVNINMAGQYTVTMTPLECSLHFP